MNLKSDNMVVFTDGASRGNPGPGGWAAIIIFSEENNNRGPLKVESEKLKVVELGGRAEYTTNNRMELSAAIEALSFIKKNQGPTFNREQGRTLIFYSDSSYLVNGITKWIFHWQKNHWRTAQKNPVENRDLWEKLAEFTAIYRSNMEWKLVGGHAGLPGNERCDEIATAFADGKMPTLYSGPLDRYPVKNILDVNLYDISYKTKNADKHKSRLRSKLKAYSYVSMAGGKIAIHKTWAECGARVKGKSGAKYKKAFSVEDENGIIREFEKS